MAHDTLEKGLNEVDKEILDLFNSYDEYRCENSKKRIIDILNQHPEKQEQYEWLRKEGIDF